MTHYTRRTQNKSSQGRQPQRRAPQRDNGQRKPTGNLKEQFNKYVNMAKEAKASGDHVQSEYYYQHAEHYGRVLAERLAQAPKPRETQPREAQPQEASKATEPSVSVPINAPAEPKEAAPADEPKEKKPVRRTVRKKVAEPKEDKAAAPATENSSLT